jgi:hypothetical protein
MVKDLTSGEQHACPIDDVVAAVRSVLTAG